MPAPEKVFAFVDFTMTLSISKVPAVITTAVAVPELINPENIVEVVAEVLTVKAVEFVDEVSILTSLNVQSADPVNDNGLLNLVHQPLRSPAAIELAVELPPVFVKKEYLNSISLIVVIEKRLIPVVPMFPVQSVSLTTAFALFMLKAVAFDALI